MVKRGTLSRKVLKRYALRQPNLAKRIFKSSRRKFVRGPYSSLAGRTAFSGRCPFAPSMKVKHRYSESFVLTSNVGAIFGTEKVWSINNLYDPDFSAVGHQPYSRDTLYTIYQNYKVYGVKVRAVFTDPSADGLIAGMLATAPGDGTTLSGMSYAVAKEKFNCWTREVNNSGSQKVVMSKYFPMQQILGISRLQFDADVATYSAEGGTGPTQIPALRMAVMDLRGTATSPTIVCDVELTFYCKWWNRKTLAQS